MLFNFGITESQERITDNLPLSVLSYSLSAIPNISLYWILLKFVLTKLKIYTETYISPFYFQFSLIKIRVSLNKDKTLIFYFVASIVV